MTFHSLFAKSPLEGIELFELPIVGSPDALSRKMPIGKQMEFAFAQVIDKSEDYELVLKSIQIPSEGITLGELDFLIRELSTGRMIHVELVSKFYLYIPWIGSDCAGQWVGPNFKDRLNYKLNKLTTHQFPILFEAQTKATLLEHGISDQHITQALCFWAQLYLPFGQDLPVDCDSINPAAISGHWINWSQFNEMNDPEASYHCCEKWEWIRTPGTDTDWVDVQKVKGHVHKELRVGRSPLVWVREDDQVRRVFVIPDGKDRTA